MSVALKKLASGGVVGIVSILTSSLLRLVLLGVLSRLLSPEDYGIYVLGISLLALLFSFSTLGLPSAILRWGAIYSSQDKRKHLEILLAASFSLTGLFSIAIALIIAKNPEYLQKYLVESLTENTLILVVAILPLFVLVEVVSAAFRSKENIVGYFGIKELLPIVVQIILIFVLMLFYIDLFVAVSSLLIAYGVSLVAGILFFIKKYHSINVFLLKEFNIFRGDLKSITKFCVVIMLIGLLGVLKDRLPIFLLEGEVSNALIGEFFNASRVAILMTIVLSGFNSILAPKVAALYEAKDVDQINLIYQSAVRWSIVVTMPVFVFLVLNSSWVMNTLFAMENETAGMILLWLTLTRLVNLFAGSPGLIFQMAGIPKYDSWFLILHVLMLALGLSLVIPLYGVLGGVLIILGVGLFVDLLRTYVVWSICKVIPIQLIPLISVLIGFSILFWFKSNIVEFSENNIMVLIVISLIIAFTMSLSMIKRSDLILLKSLMLKNKV